MISEIARRANTCCRPGSTNIVAFLPLLLVKGKTGDFSYSLPVVVSLG